MIRTYRIKAYLEYEIEADSEEQSIERFKECLAHDLEEIDDIREIAEINSEKISDYGIEDPDND